MSTEASRILNEVLTLPPAERAQLAGRVERIEHHLDDLTGSIEAAGSFTTASMPRSSTLI